jgi:DNA-binding transcriptional LysR family regulator
MADSARAITARVTEVDERQTVVIATRDAIGIYWLTRRLPDLLRDYPGIEVNLKIMDDTPDLLAGDADMAIQFDAPIAPNIIARQLRWLHYILYASPDYLAEYGVPETKFDPGKHCFITRNGYSKQRETWSNKTQAWMEVISRSFQTNSSTVLLETCASGGGIAPVPTYVSEFEDRLIPLVHIPPLASARLWLAYSERVRGLCSFEGVLAWLRDLFDPARHPGFREAYAPPQSTISLQEVCKAPAHRV